LASNILLVPKLQLGNTTVQKLQLRLRPFPSQSLGTREILFPLPLWEGIKGRGM
jgi:hypothetical protein